MSFIQLNDENDKNLIIEIGWDIMTTIASKIYKNKLCKLHVTINVMKIFITNYSKKWCTKEPQATGILLTR